MDSALPAVLERGVVHVPSGRQDGTRIACFASLFVAETGSIFSAFQVGPEKNAATSMLRLHRSRDGARSWEEIQFTFKTTFGGVNGSLSNGEMVEVTPGRLMLLSTWINRSDPARPLFDPASEGLLRAKILKAFSVDDGRSWTEWEEVPLPGIRESVHSSGPIVKWRDGSIAFLFETHKAFDAIGPAANAEASWVMISRDGGRTFQGPNLAAKHPEAHCFYWDGRLCGGELPGEVSVYFWTHDHLRKTDLAVHRMRGRFRAGGFERGPIEDTRIPGQIAAAIALRDGRHMVFVVDREFPGSIRSWISDCGGCGWREAGPAYVHGYTDRARGMSDIEIAGIWENIGRWSFGHPAVRLLDDGDLLLVYYAGNAEGMGIRWARIAVPVDTRRPATETKA